MNVLAIGNSFSRNALHYLHGIAEADGFDLTAVNLYIGGCTLERHRELSRTGERAYELDYNGQQTKFRVSSLEALENRQWDFISLQQQSWRSADYATFQPDLGELSAYVSEHAPGVPQVLFETWAYDKSSSLLWEQLRMTDPHEMLAAVREAYRQAAGAIGAACVIPGGEVMMALSDAGIVPHHSDCFHAGHGAGEYALALTWYRTLTKRSVLGNGFRNFEVPIDEDTVRKIQELAEATEWKA